MLPPPRTSKFLRRFFFFLSFLLVIVGSCEGAKKRNNCAKITKLRFQVHWLIQAQFAGYQAAIDNGYFNDECLDVELKGGGPGSGVTTSEEEVDKGNALFGTSWLAPAIQEAAARPIVIIARTYQKGGMMAVSLKTSGIDNPRKMAGKTLSAWGGYLDYQIEAMLLNVGLNRNDTKWVSQTFTPTRLYTGSVDVVSAMTYNEYSQLLEQYNNATDDLWKPTDLITHDLSKYNADIIEDVIVANKKWLNASVENQKIAVAFLKAAARGHVYCRENPRKCVDFLYNKDDHQVWQMNEVNKLVWGGPPEVPFGILTPAEFARCWLILQNTQMSSLMNESMKYYDMTYMNQAINELLAEYPNIQIFSQNFTAPKLTWCLNAATKGAYLCDAVPRAQTYIEWGSGLAIAMAVLAALGICFTLGLGVFFYIHRDKPSIRASSPTFMGITLFGCCVSFCMVFILIGKQTTSLCIAHIWIGALAFSSVFGGLLAKTFRVYHIFKSAAQLSMSELTDKNLLAVVSGIVGVDLIICILWTAIDTPEVVLVSDVTAENTDFITCSSARRPLWLTLYFAYKGLLVFIGTVLAFKVRNVQTKFNESKWIGFSTYNILVMGAIGVPLFLLLRGIPKVNFILYCLVIILMTFFTEVILFGHKVWFIYHPASESLASGTTVARGGTADIHSFNNSSGSFVPTDPKSKAAFRDFVMNKFKEKLSNEQVESMLKGLGAPVPGEYHANLNSLFSHLFE